MKGLIIVDFNRTLYNTESNSLFAGVQEFLADYSQQYILALIGKGDDKRAHLIDELNIKKYFKYVLLKEEKEEADFSECVTRFGAHNAWSIGDRIKKEIVLSNRAGLKTIWFRNGKFASELPEKAEEKPTFVVHSFHEIRSIISL